MVNIPFLSSLLLASGFVKRSTSISVPNLSNADLLEWGFAEAVKIFDAPGQNCTKCQAGINLGKYLTLKAPTVTPDLLVKLCYHYNWDDDCEQYQGQDNTKGNMGKHLSQVFTLMDAFGLDGQNMCNWHGNEACELAEVPTPDLSSWWPEKPHDLHIIKSDNETFNVLHLSDIHLDLRYLPGQESDCDEYMCCTVESTNKKAMLAGFNSTLQAAQKLGSYHCDCPDTLVENSLKSMGALGYARDFEFGIFTGDMVSHDLQDWLSFAHTYQTEEEVYYLMKKYLGDIPVYPTFGNHDSYPYSQLAQNVSGYAGDFTWNAELSAKMWKDFGWINETTEAEAEHTYGSFAVTTKRGLRVISIDSNFWYSANYYNFWSIDKPDLSGMFKWLVDQLLECEVTGQKAWIIAHVPAQDMDGVPWVTEVFRQIVVRFSPHVIASTFFGHTHADQFNVFYAESGKWTEKSALSVGWITQSVTPIDTYNPAWRYYMVDTKTFEVMDSRNYYSPLNETYDYSLDKYSNHTLGDFTYKVFEPQTPKQMIWRWEYSARESYGSDWPENAPLNATFWHRAAKKIVEDEQMRQTYFDHYFRKSPFTRQGCEGKCLHDTFCSFVSGSQGERSKCLHLKVLPVL